MNKIAKRSVAFLLLFLVLSMVACAGTDADRLWESALYSEDATLGTGAVIFTVKVTAAQRCVTLTVRTDKDTVGDALLQLSLIQGTEGPYGLYMDAVNGMVAAQKDSWWKLTEEGEMVWSAIDKLPVREGAVYELTYTVGY